MPINPTLGTAGVTEVVTAPLVGTTTGIVTPTGDNNSTNVFGFGNNAATLTGNNNKNNAIGPDPS